MDGVLGICLFVGVCDVFESCEMACWGGKWEGSIARAVEKHVRG